MKMRLVSWLAWANFVLCAAAYLGMWALYARLDPALLAEHSYHSNERFFAFGLVLAFPLIGALILSFRPGNLIGVLHVIVGLVNAVMFFATPYLMVGFWVAPAPLPFSGELNVLRNTLWIWQFAAFSLLLLLFPTGRLLSRRWWWVAAAGLAAAALLFGWASVLTYVERDANPFLGLPSNRDDPGWPVYAALFVLLLTVPLSLVSTVRRWLSARDLERQQMKWLLLGGLLMVLPLAFLITLDLSGNSVILPLPLEIALANLVYLALPAAVGVAILRHRLFDIDLIIRRTLQYTLLTGLLALAYFGGVVVLQGLLEPLTGSDQSPLITVVTTLAVAALFNPLRARTQAFIDRRFFRSKYDAELALFQFSSAARNEVDMESLTAALFSVVEGTMQPEKASVWLKRSGTRDSQKRYRDAGVWDQKR